LCSYDGVLRPTSGTNVINLSNSAGKGITWKVEVASAGTYALQWRYAGGGSAAVETAKLMINGATAIESVYFPKPKDSNTFLTTSPVTATFVRGVNEIRMETTQAAPFADIEWVEVTGDTPLAADCSRAIGSGGGSDPEPVVYQLHTTVNGEGTVDPATGPYEAGSAATLTATPAAGWKFEGWSGGATGAANPLTLIMDGDKAVTATFSRIMHQLTITTNGQGRVYPGSGTFAEGYSVTLTATPAQGWKFDNWSGDASGSSPSLTLTVDAAKAVVAHFSEVTHQLTTSATGQGTVAPAQGTYAAGTSVTVTATPAAGWKFDFWSGDATGSTNPLTVVMNGDKAVVANFSRIEYRVTVIIVGDGSVSFTDRAYYAGESAVLTALANPGSQFSGWSGDATGSTNPLSIPMTGDKTVTATFTKNGSKNSGVVTVYPNPFKGSTTFEVSLAKKARVKISILRSNGSLLEVVTNQSYNAGTNLIPYTNWTIQPGMYFYVVEIDKEVIKDKLIAE
jgi:uncharacterized repeat protein (TIGR02543 family)